MPSPPKPPPELFSICSRWSKKVSSLTSKKARIAFFRKELSELLLNNQLFISILSKITTGGTYPDIRRAMMFENEFLLYLNSSHLFSLRMFIYEPGEYTPIHDHNSWGVTGSVSGNLEVIKYVREDDGATEEIAHLRASDRYELAPADTEITLPLGAGIHQTGNPSSETMIMISIYGPPIRRLYINQFDMDNNRVSKIYPPKLKKKMLAAQALQTL